MTDIEELGPVIYDSYIRHGLYANTNFKHKRINKAGPRVQYNGIHWLTICLEFSENPFSYKITIRCDRYFVSSIEINLMMTPQFQVFYYNNPEMIFLISLSMQSRDHLYIKSRNKMCNSCSVIKPQSQCSSSCQIFLLRSLGFYLKWNFLLSDFRQGTGIMSRVVISLK